MSAAIETEASDAAQRVSSVSPDATEGSRAIEAELRDRLGPLFDCWHALRRLQREDKPGLKARVRILKAIEHQLASIAEEKIAAFFGPSASEAADGSDESTSVAAHAPTPALEGGGDE